MKLVCIQCPVGCHLEIDEKCHVKGNNCPRGEKYAIQEMTHPMRTLTTTVSTNSIIHRQLPVITKNPVPKEKMMEVMQQQMYSVNSYSTTLCVVQHSGNYTIHQVFLTMRNGK